jgi:hypothetical protein
VIGGSDAARVRTVSAVTTEWNIVLPGNQIGRRLRDQRRLNLERSSPTAAFGLPEGNKPT